VGLSAEEAIRALLAQRGPDKTICPSEAARALDPDGWRAQMPTVREAAARMAAEGEIEATQGGAAVDPLAARGPIRLRIAAPPSP
jgi:hypothetical protein